MSIIEYKFHATGDGMKCPPWVADGGYWYNSEDHTYIGISPDSTEYYIPDTVNKLTTQQLEDRQVLIHKKTPMLKRVEFDDTEMSESEVKTMIQNWIKIKS